MADQDRHCRLALRFVQCVSGCSLQLLLSEDRRSALSLDTLGLQG